MENMNYHKSSSRTKYSAINATTEIIGQFVTIVLSFVSRTVFINTLGSDYLGINGLFSDILRMLSLSEMGLDTAMNFKLYKPLAENDTDRLQVLMKFYKTAYRVIAVVFIVLGIVLLPFLKYLIKDYDSLSALNVNASLIFVLYIIQSASSYLFAASKAAIIKADQKMYITTSIATIINIFKNIAQIVSLYLFKDFTVFTAITIFFVIIQNLITAIIAQRMYPKVFKHTDNSIRKSEIKDTFKDLGALFLYKANSVVIKATDNIVLSTFIGLVIVGPYSNYLLIYSAISAALLKIYSSVKASMGNLFTTADLDKQYKFFEFTNYISIVIFGTASIGFAVCCDEVINIWIGAKYVINQPLSILIGVELLFAGIKINLGQIRTITGLYRQMWFRPVMGMIINIVLSIVLVFPLGIYGVIIGTIASDFFANFLIDPKVIHNYYFKKPAALSTYYMKNTIYFLLIIFVGAIDYYLCRYFSVDNQIINLIIHFLICLFSFPATCICIFWKKEENKYLISIPKKILHRLN